MLGFVLLGCGGKDSLQFLWLVYVRTCIYIQCMFVHVYMHVQNVYPTSSFFCVTVFDNKQYTSVMVGEMRKSVV